MKLILLSFVSAFLFCFPPAAMPQSEIDGNPYNPGENLFYEGKYKTLGLAFSIANFKFTVSKAKSNGDFFVKTEAESKGTLAKLFNFSFVQRFESTVDGKKLQILKTKKRDEQRKRIRESEADFDYLAKRVTYSETDPNDPSRPPRRVASSIEENTQDIISAVYLLRKMPLAVGKKFVLKVSDSGLVYDVPVSITEREQKKTILGKVWCWKVEPEIFGDGRFIERKGSLTIWITDDGRRIPVRAKVDTTMGNVEIKLKRISNIKRQPPENKQPDAN